MPAFGTLGLPKIGARALRVVRVDHRWVTDVMLRVAARHVCPVHLGTQLEWTEGVVGKVRRIIQEETVGKMTDMVIDPDCRTSRVQSGSVRVYPSRACS